MSEDFPLEFVKEHSPFNEVLQNLDQNLDSFIEDFSNKSRISKNEYDAKCDETLKKLDKLNTVTTQKIDEVIFNGLNDVLEERNLEKLKQYLEIKPNKAFDGKSIPSQATLLSFIQQVTVLFSTKPNNQTYKAALNWLEVVFDNLDETDPLTQCFLNPVLDILLPYIEKLSAHFQKALLILHFIRNLKDESIDQ